ncbi:MAG: tetratricopeptide repeat protein [Acidobacteria bacterium]|nr:tetratricopeptide repeat protein [Acidobacteriota bacterium]
MSLLHLRRVVGFLIVLGALTGVAPLLAQTGGLTGKALDETGNPLVGYPVIIERQDIKGTYKTKTNKKGEYIYIGLPIGNYKVSLQDPQGRVLFFFTARVGLGEPTPMDFDLAKEKAIARETQQKQIEENPEMKRQMEEQAKEQKEFTGLKDIFEQGNSLYAQNKYPEAAGFFEKALPLAKDKNLAIVLAKLGDTYHKARQFDKSADNYRKAIELKPEEATYHNGLGNAYAEMGKIPEAAEEFKKAAELDPTQASRFYFNYGAVMYNTGKMDEAAGAFKKAVEIDRNFADAHFLLAQTLMGKVTYDDDGNVIPPEGQIEALEAYLELEPQGKNAPAAQQLLQTLQGKIETQFTKAKKKKKG